MSEDNPTQSMTRSIKHRGYRLTLDVTVARIRLPIGGTWALNTMFTLETLNLNRKASITLPVPAKDVNLGTYRAWLRGLKMESITQILSLGPNAYGNLWQIMPRYERMLAEFDAWLAGLEVAHDQSATPADAIG